MTARTWRRRPCGPLFCLRYTHIHAPTPELLSESRCAPGVTPSLRLATILVDLWRRPSSRRPPNHLANAPFSPASLYSSAGLTLTTYVLTTGRFGFTIPPTIEVLAPARGALSADDPLYSYRFRHALSTEDTPCMSNSGAQRCHRSPRTLHLPPHSLSHMAIWIDHHTLGPPSYSYVLSRFVHPSYALPLYPGTRKAYYTRLIIRLSLRCSHCFAVWIR